MASLNRRGGASALFIAASYVFGFALFAGVIDRTGYDGPGGDIAFVSDHFGLLSAAIICLYPLAACALCVLTIALRERLGALSGKGGWSDVAALFGAFWAALLFASGFVGLVGMEAVVGLAASAPATARSAWTALPITQDALGGGIELVGGVWMALISALSLRAGLTGKALGVLGIAIGAVGMATVVPAMTGWVDVFGLGQIVWFALLGTTLIRNAPAKQIA